MEIRNYKLDLLPCPFCGGEAVVKVMKCISSSGKFFLQYSIVCEYEDRDEEVDDLHCFASTGWHKSLDAAAREWNMRPEHAIEYKLKTEFVPAELKPCPWCGSEARLIKITGSMWSPEACYRVDCINADCPAGTYGDPDPDIVVAQWNRRGGIKDESVDS